MSNYDGLYTRDELIELGIYELRDLGRSLGVSSPTTLKKEELVDKILAIIYGEVPVRNIGKGRGRPARTKDKPNRLFVDLIDKLEEPKVERNFIYSDGEVEINYTPNSLLTSKVASMVSSYVNDSSQDKNSMLRTGVVCVEDGKYYARKLKFVPSETDCEIPGYVVKDYQLKENDRIEYIVDDDGKTMLQLFKVNEKLAEKKAPFDEISELEKGKAFYVNQTKILLNSANIIYAGSIQERKELVDEIALAFENLEYNTVKVCFDRNENCKDKNSGLSRAEVFASCVGDEFETMAMAESGLSKAVFFRMIGNKSVLLLDNLAWLLSVIETYPKSIYGNFIEKLVKSCDTSNITLICVSGHLNNEKLKELSNYFVNIN